MYVIVPQSSRYRRESQSFIRPPGRSFYISHPLRTVSLGETVTRQQPKWTPGGTFAPKLAPSTLRGMGLGFGECVPVPVVLTNPAVINRAIAENRRYATSLGWRPLIDQIEVNLLGCLRAAPQLFTTAAADFAQAVALFQTNQRMPVVDGQLGPNTWTRMKAITTEHDPFPRQHPPSLDYDNTASAGHSDGLVHPAIDIVLNGGTPVPVVGDGRVIYAGFAGSVRNCNIVDRCRAAATWAADPCMFLHYGRTVIVEHPDRGPGMQPGGDSVYTIYGHLQFRGTHSVGSGEPVRAGRIIGEIGAGCVGNSNGPHLHYSVATGPRSYRFRGGSPARCELFTDAFCRRADSQCTRCNFTHFWDVVTSQRPRTTIAAGFRW
jgi:murein DD-endopeptidase MepM/ murein hydrolase activator NlpD